MKAFSVEIAFESLPVWHGAQETPGLRAKGPIRLGWCTQGYVGRIAAPGESETVVQAYGQVGYRHITALPGSSSWGSELARRKLALIDRFIGRLKGDVMDVGGGNFYIPSRLVARDRPSSYTLIDPSLREAAPEGIRAVPGHFPDALPDAQADVVLSFGVFEHVPDPLEFAQAIRATLAQRRGARALLYFPTAEYQMLSGDLGVLEHEHLSYFTRASAERLFAKAGLKIESLVVEDHNIVTVLTAAEPVANGAISPDPFLIDAAGAFHRSLTRAETEVRAALARGSVAFHGANGALEKFLHLSGLGGEEGIDIYDLDDEKTGRFLQTHHRPIRHVSDPNYKSAPTVFVSAMVFYDEIRASLLSAHERLESSVLPLFDSRP